MTKEATVRAKIDPDLKDVAVPNKITEQVFQDTDAGRNLVKCENADDMFEKLGI